MPVGKTKPIAGPTYGRKWRRNVVKPQMTACSRP
jgi:hypothetical protein